MPLQITVSTYNRPSAGAFGVRRMFRWLPYVVHSAALPLAAEVLIGPRGGEGGGKGRYPHAGALLIVRPHPVASPFHRQ